MKFSNRQISPPTVPQRTVHPDHPISASPRLIARPESTDNRPIVRWQSSDAAAKIVRDRQAKRANRQSPTLCGTTSPVVILGIWETVHNPNFNSGEFAIIRSQAGLNSYPPIAEIVQEMSVIAAKARETDKALRGILKQLGVSA